MLHFSVAVIDVVVRRSGGSVPGEGIECHRAELWVLVQGADVLTSPTHRHSVAWLSPQKGGRSQAPDRAGDRSGTMQRRTSSRPLKRLRGRRRVRTARGTSLIGLDAPGGVRGEG